MSRAINLLTARAVATLKVAGRHADGGGLYFRITPAGSRSWVFMTARGGKRVEIGLGAANAVSLARARALAAEMRELAATGGDPRAVLRAELVVAPTIITFGAFADEYITTIEEGWKNEVHRQQWRQSLRDHAAHLRDIPIAEIGTEDVLTVLRPIWTQKAETAKRVRGRIERILDAAKAKKLRPLDAMNPATYRGHLSHLLPTQSKLARGHHAALPWQELPTFMEQLRQRTALAARCLEFVILTAARSGEALGATWGEVDLERRLWTVPAVRMKAGVEHIVPLSASALAILQGLRPATPAADMPIFAVGGATRSNMAMAMLLRRMGRDDITTHGFRSTFRDWAGDKTPCAREVIEHALAHTIQNKAERSYRRGTAVEKRAVLMQAWSEYSDGLSIAEIVKNNWGEKNLDEGSDGDGAREEAEM